MYARILGFIVAWSFPSFGRVDSGGVSNTLISVPYLLVPESSLKKSTFFSLSVRKPLLCRYTNSISVERSCPGIIRERSWLPNAMPSVPYPVALSQDKCTQSKS